MRWIIVAFVLGACKVYRTNNSEFMVIEPPEPTDTGDTDE